MSWFNWFKKPSPIYKNGLYKEGDIIYKLIYLTSKRMGGELHIDHYMKEDVVKKYLPNYYEVKWEGWVRYSRAQFPDGEYLYSGINGKWAEFYWLKKVEEEEES